VAADDDRSARARACLAAVGAPLMVAAPPPTPLPPLADVVADGLWLAHTDDQVATVMPVLFWRVRHRLDYEALLREAAERNERQTLGFFLELTGQLGERLPDEAQDAVLARQLKALGESLWDRRSTATLRLFFDARSRRLPLVVALANTPPLARRWGFLMNGGMKIFASAFTEHVGVADTE